MKYICTWRLGLLLIILISSQSGTAQARDRSPCLEEAEMKYNMADFEGALKILDNCLKQVSAPAPRACVHAARGFNLAELRRLSAARKAFREAIRLDIGACGCSRAYKEELIVGCRAQQAKMKGTLLVRCNRPGAEVLIDGVSKGKAPITVTLPIGSYLVTVLAPDGKRRTQKVHLPDGRKLRVTLRLPTIDDKPGEDRRLWTWVAGGLAVAAAGAATGVWFAGDSQHSDWQDIAIREKTRALTTNEEQELADLQSAVEQKEVAAYALWGVAGAAAAAAVTLFFMERRGKNETPVSRASLSPVFGGVNGLVARVEF